MRTVLEMQHLSRHLKCALLEKHSDQDFALFVKAAQAFNEKYIQSEFFKREKNPEIYRDEFNSRSWCVMLSGEEVIGRMSVEPSSSMINPQNRTAYFSNFVIFDQKNTGKGYGRALYKSGIYYAQEQKFKSAELIPLSLVGAKAALKNGFDVSVSPLRGAEEGDSYAQWCINKVLVRAL